MATTNRHRQTDTRSKSHYTVTDYNPGSSTPSSIDTGGSERLAFGDLKIIDDVYDKSYFAKKRAGQVVLHPMSLTRDARTSVESNWSFGPHPAWGTRVITGTMACEHSVPPSGGEWSAFHDNLTVAKDLALVKAYAKMKSPDVLLGVTLHEREKTLHMLKKPLASSAELAERIFARKLSLMRRGWTAARALAQAWLELRFGWRPLMYDISGIAKAATSVKPSSVTLLVARSGVNSEYNNSYADTTSSINGVTVDRRGSWSSKAKVSAGVLYRLRDVSEEVWRNHCLGLDLSSVPASLWDGLLLSFVADYYYAVGAWLSAITPNPLFEVMGNWVTTVERQQNDCHIVDARLTVNNSPVTTYHASGGSYYEVFEYVSREVGRSLPTAPPRIVIPLSFSKIVDQVALLVGGVNSRINRL